MKKTYFCVRCHLVYEEGEDSTEDEKVCVMCGGELAEIDKDTEFDEGGES
jgi:transcription initiation factor IIE alpha subunit